MNFLNPHPELLDPSFREVLDEDYIMLTPSSGAEYASEDLNTKRCDQCGVRGLEWRTTKFGERLVYSEAWGPSLQGLIHGCDQ